MPEKISVFNQNDVLALLFQTSYKLTLVENEQSILHITADALRQTGCISALLLVGQEQLNYCSFFDPESGEQTYPTGIKLPQHKVASLFNTAALILVNEAPPPETILFELLTPYYQLGCRSVALVPIFAADQFIGLVIMASRLPDPLTSEILEPFTRFTSLIGADISRLRMLQKTQTRLNGMHRSVEIALNVLFETDLEPLYKNIHSQIRQILGSVDFLIAIYSPDTNLIELPYVFEKEVRISIDPFQLGEGLTSLLIKNRKPLMFIDDAENQAKALGAKIVGLPAKSWIGVPLLVGEQVIGAMIVEDVEHEHRFTEDDLEFIMALSPHVAASIRNAQTVTEIQAKLKAYDEEKYLLNTLMDTISDKIYFKDRDSRFIRANKAMQALFNLGKLSDIVGKSDFDFFSKEHASQTFQDEQEMIRSGVGLVDKIEKETWPGRKDSYVISTKEPLRDPAGQIIGILGISRDVTELVEVRETAQRRAQQLLTAAEIARDVSGTLQTSELLSRVVNLVKDRFGFYHASVFLVNAAGNYAELRESTGEAGRQMKHAGHKLAVGSKSIVGQATASGKSLVSNDVTQDTTHLPNPLLPETQAELAIPLKIAGRILGALDVQHTHRNAFSEDDISILQTLADQLSTAIVNAELFAETQKSLTQHRVLHEITTSASLAGNIEDALVNVVQGLQTIIEDVRVAILLNTPSSGELAIKAWKGYPENININNLKFQLGEGITGISARTREAIYIAETNKDARYIAVDHSINTELAIPLLFRDELLGVLNLESPRTNAFSVNDQEVLETLASSVAVVIANTRLVEQIRKQVDRQQQLFEAASRIRRSVDMKAILETSAIEIGKAMGAQRARIELAAKPGSADPGKVGQGSIKELDQ